MTFARIWERLLDSLDSSGGHIFVLCVLLLVGVGMVHFGIGKGEDVLMGAFGALLLTLKTAHSNYTRHNGPPPTVPPAKGNV